MAIESFIHSQHAEIENAQKLVEWEADVVGGVVVEKACACINLYNNHPVKPLPLITKESRSLMTKLSKIVRDRVYSLHRLIMIVYSPAVLMDTQGVLSAKIFNQSTGESISLVENHLVSKAAVFVSRWPRAVLADSPGLALLVSVSGVPIKTGGLVGVMHPAWEDSLSSKMVYERTLPSLSFPIDEQAPAMYIKDLSMLKRLVYSHVHVGKIGVDIHPVAVNHGLPALPQGGAGIQPVVSGKPQLLKGKGSKQAGATTRGGGSGHRAVASTPGQDNSEQS